MMLTDRDLDPLTRPSIDALEQATHHQQSLSPTRTISRDGLRAALGSATDDAEIMVVAPALHRSALRFWLSDADEGDAAALQERFGLPVQQAQRASAAQGASIPTPFSNW